MWRELIRSVVLAAILVALALFTLAPIKRQFVATLAAYEVLHAAH